MIERDCNEKVAIIKKDCNDQKIRACDKMNSVVI